MTEYDRQQAIDRAQFQLDHSPYETDIAASGRAAAGVTPTPATEREVCDLKEHLAQALRQWRMYANDNDGRELETCPSEEGQIYRAAMLAAAPGSTSVAGQGTEPELDAANRQVAELEKLIQIACDYIPYTPEFTNALISYDKKYGRQQSQPAKRREKCGCISTEVI